MLAFMVMVLNAQATEVEIEGRRLAGPAESGADQKKKEKELLT